MWCFDYQGCRWTMTFTWGTYPFLTIYVILAVCGVETCQFCAVWRTGWIFVIKYFCAFFALYVYMIPAETLHGCWVPSMLVHPIGIFLLARCSQRFCPWGWSQWVRQYIPWLFAFVVEQFYYFYIPANTYPAFRFNWPRPDTKLKYYVNRVTTPIQEKKGQKNPKVILFLVPGSFTVSQEVCHRVPEPRWCTEITGCVQTLHCCYWGVTLSVLSVVLWWCHGESVLAVRSCADHASKVGIIKPE